MKPPVFSKILPDEEHTLLFGAELAKVCGDTAIIFLQGDLGAGKTTLTRGFLRGLGYEGKVKSPTYTLVEPYEINTQKVFHFDFYRLRDPQELEFIGLPDYFIPDAICIVEWPQNGGQLLPAADLSCYIEPYLKGRQIRIEAHTPHGQLILLQLDGVQNQ
jgi:tRNA threonylcarbamoyladenosine biosynthesis protein TsaE